MTEGRNPRVNGGRLWASLMEMAKIGATDKGGCCRLALTDEEGSRFVPPMVASGVFAGVFDLEYGLSREDEAGATIGEELERIGYAGDDEVGNREAHAFFEVHIEQGPVLEEEGSEIGVVTHGQGIRWYALTLEGFESHAGPTPMDRRRDELLGAARVIELVNSIGLDNPPLACATFGTVRVFPNSPNVIPGRVFLTIDVRHPEDEVLSEMDLALRAGVELIGGDSGLQVDLEQTFYSAPVLFDDGCITAVRDAATSLGYSHRDMVAGAGHDACYLARAIPTSMIFVPCVGGISHNEIEDAKPEWITAGCNVLLRAVLKKAGERRGES